jgi:hypothetical protein
MRFYIFFFAIILLSSILFAQDDGPKEFKFGTLAPLNFESEYTSLVFTNINISNNSPAPQNEPSIRISRTNPNIVVAAWRDFRLDYVTPIRRIGYSYSTNGGLTWSASQLLPDPNPNHVSQSDPVLTSDAQGNFYLSSTSRKPVSGYNRDQLVYKSTNNGQTFVEYSIGIPGAGGGGEDKEWMFCDPVPSNPTYNNIMMTSTNTVNGIIRFAKSTNGGLNWSAPINMSDASTGTGSNLCTGTGGQIYVVWAGTQIYFDKSTNGGASFGTDVQLSTPSSIQGFPFICCDYSNRPTRGNVYVIWDDAHNGTADVWVQRSTNGGISWLAAPVRVNDVTTNSQMWPVIQCDTNGFLYAMYYDNRVNTSSWNSYVAYSTDQGNTWVNQQLSDSSFAMTTTNSDVRYGDYIGIDAFNGIVIPVWTDQRKGVPNQEIYSARLSNIVPVANNNSEVPEEYVLYQNYPNPFNPSTSIEYSIPRLSFVSIKVFDVVGKEVQILFEGKVQAGTYNVSFDASGLASGVYFYTLTADGFRETKKMLLVK